MGQGLRKPVRSIVVKRHPEKLFRVGLAEMNGWRNSMEDAHIIHGQDSWGFFAVFDGHGGSQCSSFVSKRMKEELVSKGMPKDDDTMRSLVMQLDGEFLESKQPSGSTGTFAIVQPESAEGRMHLRIGNIGDSRVLLGRADGTMVEGTGTDGGLTTDHKPDNADERARIQRTGGTVEFVQGVPRVNGDLAVSRAFGDEHHKKSGPSAEEQPVSAVPEFTSLSCDSTDFLMLVCDGISEGTFPNREVVQLAAAELRKGDRPDPGAAATSICNMALDKGSTDNLSCMIVLFGCGDIPGARSELLPGLFMTDATFRKAYAAMAEHAGLSLAQAIELRYDLVKQLLTDPNATDLSDLQEEMQLYGSGPPQGLAQGSAERTQWFTTWLQEHCNENDDQSIEEMISNGSLRNNPEMLLEMARARGLVQEPQATRCVRVGRADHVRAEMAKIPGLPPWRSEVEQVCGMQGAVHREDESDGTAEVVFEHNSISIWLPMSALSDVMMEVGTEEQLKPAVEAHSALKWNDRLVDTCGKHGVLLKKDTDGTSHLRFPALNDMAVWLPSSCLVHVEDAGDSGSGGAENGEDAQAAEAVEVQAESADDAKNATDVQDSGSPEKRQRTSE
jgi:serine/threonine protein phosphatase PrpC